MNKKPNKVNSKPTRIDWETNHEMLRVSFLKLLKKKGSMPTSYELAEATGLSRSAVVEHYKHLKFEPQAHQSRALTNDIILAVAQSAKRGNSQAQKLWFQIMEGWKESINQNHTGSWAGAMQELSQSIPNEENNEESEEGNA